MYPVCLKYRSAANARSKKIVVTQDPAMKRGFKCWAPTSRHVQLMGIKVTIEAKDLRCSLAKLAQSIPLASKTHAILWFSSIEV